MANIKKILIVSKVLTLAFGGVVFAASADQPTATETIQPYVVATQNTGTMSFDETGKLKIVQDMFVAAEQSPIWKTKIAREMYVQSTGYNSLPEQTDDSPFIAADGTHVYDGMVAANFLPFGTKIMFPDQFPGKIFTVHDRMNKRYWERVDVWFAEKPTALKWGVRTVRIVILES